MEDERGPGLDFTLCFVCGSRPRGAVAFLLCLVILLLKCLNVRRFPPPSSRIYHLRYIGAETREEGGTRCQRAAAPHGRLPHTKPKVKSRPGPLSSSNVVTPPFIPSGAPPWDSRPVSGAGVVHYHSLHRPRSVPTALGPAPLVTVPYKYPMCTMKYTAVFFILWAYISAGGPGHLV